jgi:hypothetical protein
VDSPEYIQDSNVTVEDAGVREGREPNVGGFLMAAAFTVLVVVALSAIYTMLR